MSQKITEWDIEDVDVLRAGTVYKLTGHGGETLVIKCEQSANIMASHLKPAKVTMRAVDPKGANVKTLDDSEKNGLQDWVNFIKQVTKDFAENKLSTEQVDSVKDLEKGLQLNRTNLWYKMPTADLTDAGKMLDKRMDTGNPDKSVMRLFADGLNAPGGLEQIGKIVAADMFSDNNDRFSPRGGSSRQYGSKKLEFKALVNIGNVFMIGKNTQQRIAFSGHDFLDPQSGYAKNLDMSLKDIQEGYNVAWLGSTLCDKKQRKTFAKHIINDLETILTPNRKKWSPRRKLGSDATKRLEKGMLQGMRDIVTALDGYYTGPKRKYPQGVKERCDRYKAALS